MAVFLKSLKDLKGIFFISFRNPKKLKMLYRPFLTLRSGAQSNAEADVSK